jgi:hypothetical protein
MAWMRLQLNSTQIHVNGLNIPYKNPHLNDISGFKHTHPLVYEDR